MMSTGYNHSETLQKLERLTQLETFVASQRIRIEKYKAMYETLKAEHLQSEEAKTKKDEEIQSLNQELRAAAEKLHEVMNRAALDYDVKSKECEQLRIQVLTPQKLEVLKMKLQEDAESRYKQKLEASEVELDRFRNEFNKLRYDYSFLKSEFEHEQLKSKTMLKEQEVQIKLQMDTLLKERNALFEELKEQKASVDLQKMRGLAKENTQLIQKIKSLHGELDDLQHEKEASGSQSDQVCRIQAKQLSEISRKCKILETEKETTKLQVERLQVELEKSLKLQDTLTGNVDSCQNKCKMLESKLEEKDHSSKLELNNLQISLASKLGDLQRERDALKCDVRGYQQKLGVLEENTENLKSVIKKKEEENAGRIQLARDEERSKLAEVEVSKAKLEEHISESERKLNELELSSKDKVQHLQEELNAVTQDKELLEKNVLNCRAQLQSSKVKIGQLEEEKKDNEVLKASERQLKNEFSRIQIDHSRMQEERNQLQNTVELLRNELKTAQDDLQLIKDNFQKDVSSARQRAESKNTGLVQDVSSLKKELESMKEKHQKLLKAAKKRHKQQKQDIGDLRDKLDILKLKEDQARKEKEAMTKNLNLEHGRTKRRLEKLKQRHNQFNQVLNATSVGVPEINPIVNLSNVSGILLQPKDDSRLFEDDLHSTPIPEGVTDDLSM